MLEKIKQELVVLNQELPKNNLVVWTGGNVSIRDPETGLVVIKPSGVYFEDLTPESMIVVDINGKMVEGSLKPSSDTASHLYHLPPAAGCERGGAHPFALRHRLCGRRETHPGLFDRPGR